MSKRGKKEILSEYREKALIIIDELVRKHTDTYNSHISKLVEECCAEGVSVKRLNDAYREFLTHHNEYLLTLRLKIALANGEAGDKRTDVLAVTLVEADKRSKNGQISYERIALLVLSAPELVEKLEADPDLDRILSEDTYN